jgi:hypothetical protein
MHEDGTIWNHRQAIVDVSTCPDFLKQPGRRLDGTYSGPECNCPSGELREFGHGSPCPQYRHFEKLNALPNKYSRDVDLNEYRTFVIDDRVTEWQHGTASGRVHTHAADEVCHEEKIRPERRSYWEAKALRDVYAPGHDPVKHPSHYTSHPSGLECWDVTRHMNFNLGNAIKYIWRCDLKGKPIEDLEKAVEYLQDEIAMRKKAAGDE